MAGSTSGVLLMNPGISINLITVERNKMEEEAKSRSASTSDNNSQGPQNGPAEPELEMNYSAAAFMDTDADTDF